VRVAAVALERELDVLAGDRVPAVELDAFANDEIVDEPIGRCAPRLGEARRHGLARARPDHGVVQRVEGVVRRDSSGELARVEPPGVGEK